MEHPFVSILTPTYNRRKYIPILIEIYKAQTYPKEKMEWLILDDGADPVQDLFEQASKEIQNILYIREPEKRCIGYKRNRLNKEAKGEILICMDDDDYYPECRVSHVVNAMNRFPTIELAGSSEMYYFYTKDKNIFYFIPLVPTHATNATLAYRRSYAKKHKYNEVIFSEEQSFLENYIHPMIQLDPMKTILVICHNANTYDKDKFRNSGNPLLKKVSSMKLNNFVKNKKIREMYSSM